MRLFLLVLSVFLAMPHCYAFGKSNNTEFPENEIQQTGSKYTFSDDVTLSGKVVKLKKGTTLPITLQTPIDTSTAQINDTVEATLDEDLEYEGAKIAEKGSVIYGKITKARSAKDSVKGGKVTIVFDKLVTLNNRVINIATKNIDFVITQEGMWIKTVRAVVIVALAAAYIFFTFGTGAIVVAVVAADTYSRNGCLFNIKGSDAVVPASTGVDLELSESQKVIANF